MNRHVIFDLDNCLSDDEWRIPFIRWDIASAEKRYEGYHAASFYDSPGNTDIFARFTADARPVFLTARPVAFRDQTVSWLKDVLKCADVQPLLIMRNNNDHRSSLRLKASMLGDLWHYGVDLSTIVAAFDDREDIVQAYRRAGLNAMVLKIHNACAYTRRVRIHSPRPLSE